MSKSVIVLVKIFPPLKLILLNLQIKLATGQWLVNNYSLTRLILHLTKQNSVHTKSFKFWISRWNIVKLSLGL